MRLVSGLDETLFLAIAHAGRSSDIGLWLSHVATTLGSGAVRVPVAIVALVLLLRARRKAEAIFLGGAFLTGMIASSVVKLVVDRPRPTLLPWLDDVSSASFPSGHAWNAAILYGALALVSGRAWAPWAAGALVLLIGLSRVVMGVHWPSDVAGGWLGGLAWLMMWRRFAIRR